jgi:hypothetical protein
VCNSCFPSFNTYIYSISHILNEPSLTTLGEFNVFHTE